MKAAYIESFGTPDAFRIGELPTPTPQPGEVLVRVMAASVNPVDTYIRAGKVAMNAPMPYIPGCDLAGTVVAVGLGCTQYGIGDRVWGSNQGLLGRQGTTAEFASVGEQWLYPLPDGVEFSTAAALALVGITAHLGLFWRANVQPGETVLVNGGSGAVGLAVVQMAQAHGAKVIATAGHAAKAELLTRLGADAVVNYKTEDLAGSVENFTSGRGVDVLYDTVPPTDLDRSVEMMAPFGRIVVMAGRAARPTFPNGPFYTKNLSLFGFVMFAIPAERQRQCAVDMNRWMSSGELKPIIGKSFGLGEAADAHRLQEENTAGSTGTLTGKIVILPQS